MAGLSQAKLSITQVSGSNNVKIDASVKVAFSPLEHNLIKLGLKGLLTFELWGSDGNLFNGGDDDLVNFPPRTVTKNGVQTFSPIIPSSWLDEDLGGDEIYAKFVLHSNEQAFPLNVVLKSQIVSGEF
jgi:hypothetical protein